MRENVETSTIKSEKTARDLLYSAEVALNMGYQQEKSKFQKVNIENVGKCFVLTPGNIDLPS
jgi:hypothetical protein